MSKGTETYTVFNLWNGYIQLPSRAYLGPKGSPSGIDRAYPVEIPDGHILWKLANPTDGSKPQLKILKGNIPKLEEEKKVPSKELPKALEKLVNKVVDALAVKASPAKEEKLANFEVRGIPEKEEKEEVSTESSVEEDSVEASSSEEEEETLSDELPTDENPSGILTGLEKDLESEKVPGSISQMRKKHRRRK